MAKINTHKSTPLLTIGLCAFVHAVPIQAQLLVPLVQDSAYSYAQDKDPALPEQPELLPQARGVLKASQTAEISANLTAQIETLPFKSGQYFKSGALLVQFDCTREHAEAEALQHAHNALTVKHQNITELYNAGAAGELEQSIALAEKQRAAADIKVAKARLTECEIYAPYSGYIQTRHVSAYDTAMAGEPLLSIIRSGRPEITLIAPSAWMRWMKAGMAFDFTIDETGGTHTAKVIRFGAAVDPVSQTIEVTAQFTSSAKDALSGMSGIASFDAPQERG